MLVTDSSLPVKMNEVNIIQKHIQGNGRHANRQLIINQG